MSFLVLGNFRWNHYLYSFCVFCIVLGHLTLKPSTKTKKQQTTKKKKTKTETTTSNHKTKQNKQPKTRPTQKRKTKKKHKNNQTLVVLTLLQLCQTKNRMTWKPEKKKTNKNTLLPCSKTTHYLSSIFCFLFTYSNCIATAVFLWKHYKNSVFRKHSFSKTQLVKPTFSPMSKTPFSKKRCLFWFWAISVETTIFIVFLGWNCFGQKNFGQNR